MTAERIDIPSREQVLSVVWRLLNKAEGAAEPDHSACAKYCEILLKRGSVGKAGMEQVLPEDLAREIAEMNKE